MSHPQWMDYQFNQQHRAELMREAAMQHLATIAMADDPKTYSRLQTLLNRTGHSLVTIGERLQERSSAADVKTAFEQS